MNTIFLKKIINNPNKLFHQPFGSIYFANTINFKVSSSEIRHRYKNNLSCKNLLPYSVQKYIKENNLYQ